MSKIKANTIENVAGTKSVPVDTLTALSTQFSHRNKIINGGFDVWQYPSTTQTSSGYGSDDRWINSNAGTTKVHTQQAFALGQADVDGNPKYYSRTVVTSSAGAGNFALKSQRVESVNTFAGTTVTLSFWAKADTAKNIALEFVQNFGTGGTPSSEVDTIGSQLIALTTSWAKYTITVAIPSIAGKALGTDGNDYLSVNLWMDAGSTFNTRTASLGQQSGTFEFANVQLEEGSVATPFEQRPIGYELSLCKRYYQTYLFGAYALHGIGRSNSSSIVVGSNIPLAVQMRVTPTITQSVAVSDAAVKGISGVSSGTSTMYATSTAADYLQIRGQGTGLTNGAYYALGTNATAFTAYLSAEL